MSNSHLPERASLEYLRKPAKGRLVELRQVDSKAKLAAALFSVARDHGFPSWRAPKAEIEQQTKEMWRASLQPARRVALRNCAICSRKTPAGSRAPL